MRKYKIVTTELIILEFLFWGGGGGGASAQNKNIFYSEDLSKKLEKNSQETTYASFSNHKVNKI